MKKIAFYVEGQTEQFFVKELIIAIAGLKNIYVELEKYAGRQKSTIKLLELAHTPDNPNYFALIYDCCGDGSVKARMLEDNQRLFSVGYSRIVGLRDLYPLRLTDLNKLENTLKSFQPLPQNTDIVIAVHEIEAWFLSESFHYMCVDPELNSMVVKNAAGFDPILDDMTLLYNPAIDIDRIYRAVQKRYSKNKIQVQKTVQCIDYTNLYLNIRYKIDKLNYLISIIDEFLS